jgi:hypothetical protein
MFMKKLLSYFIALVATTSVWAQQDSVPVIDSSKYVKFFKVQNLSEVEELDFKMEDTIPKDFKAKKPKRKVYYGYKTKKAFIKTVSGQNVTVEIFHYLKAWQDPDAYVPDIYWFDPTKMKIVESKKYDKATSKILHGPYKKIINGEVVEEGIYYIGTKHGRWMNYDQSKDFAFRTGDKDHFEKTPDGEKIMIYGSDTIIRYQLLESKVKYNRGWSKYAKLSYYDYAKEKLKEVMPYNEKGDKTGEYFSFFEDGHIQSHGYLFKGVKVGTWAEYQSVKGKVRKVKEIKYPDVPQEKNPEGELIKQWNEKGELIYDKKEKIDLRNKESQTEKK